MTLPEFNPVLFGVFLLLAVHLAAVLTGLGAFPTAVFSEYVAGAKKKVFLKKFAQQVSQLGIMFVFYTVVAAFGSLAVFYFKFPELIQPWLDSPLLLAPTLGALAWTFVFSLIYAFSWKGSRKAPQLHKLWGVLASLGAIATLATSLSTKLMVLMGAPLPATGVELSTYLSRGMSSMLFTPLFLQPVLEGFALAGALGLIWMVIRRNRDDWGRDYYNFAAKYCAGWALVTTLLATATEGYVYWTIMPTVANTPHEALLPFLAGGGAVCALIACLFWSFIMRSKTPMRNKFSMIMGLMLIWLALAGFSATSAMVFIQP